MTPCLYWALYNSGQVVDTHVPLWVQVLE